MTSLVLCSVDDPAATLKEVRRVLAPGGRYLLLEHGLAPDAGVQNAVFGCFRDDAPKFAAFTTMAQAVPSGSEMAL